MINDTHNLPQQQPTPDVHELSPATHSEHDHKPKLTSNEEGSESTLRPSVVLQDQDQNQGQLSQKLEASNSFSSQDTEPDEKKRDGFLSGLDTSPVQEDDQLDIRHVPLANQNASSHDNGLWRTFQNEAQRPKNITPTISLVCQGVLQGLCTEKWTVGA